ncbi:hypothetical protein JST97_06155 [bacterium]|nr:hypothetical protein [bacterium]
MTYAQARLRLGICAVGWWVSLAALALFTGADERLSLGQLGLIYLLASVPLDLLGGQLLPLMWGKPRVRTLRWCRLYVKAAVLHLAIWWVQVSLLSWLYRSLGLWAALLLFGLASAGLLAHQLRLLDWLGVPLRRQPWGWEVGTADTRFSGGLLGLPWPGREEVVVPSQWLAPQAPSGLEACIRRRRNLSLSSSRAVGVLLALAFNAVALGYALTWSDGHPTSTACWVTMLSFGGLLVLPSGSRPGVLAADRSSELRTEWWRWLEVLQEEDPLRHGMTERIFHPIPQWSERERQFGARPGELKLVPWNLARYALLTSWLCGSLLSRAVHCNCGRPELWFWPPGD